MKRIVCIMAVCCSSFRLSAQTYDEWVSRAMDAVEKDSLCRAEEAFKEALQLEPSNM